jgi:hypothetical protein
MPNEFSNAHQLAQSIRYSDDVPINSVYDLDKRVGQRSRNRLLRGALRITAQVTPELHFIVTTAARRLKFPPSKVDAFVYSSSELQASCAAGIGDGCLVTISSAMVERLEPEEAIFVIGHEIGHFLLGHGESVHESEQQSSESLMTSRRQEISADRLGFVACNSLDAAIWALLKIFSGLPRSQLRFDVGEFISQIGTGEGDQQADGSAYTHPSMTLRSRALLWFSIERSSEGRKAGQIAPRGGAVDHQIRGDFLKFEDGDAQSALEEAEADVRLWAIASVMLESKPGQVLKNEALADMIGTETATKLTGFLASLTEQEISSVVQEKLELSLSHFNDYSGADTEPMVRKIQETALSTLWS